MKAETAGLTGAEVPLTSADTNLNIADTDPALYNADLAPVPKEKRKWGALEYFNVWTNDIQSLAGYTLAASLFITAGISGWYVFAAIVLAGIIVNWLVNLSGGPSVKLGVPYAVMARFSMGVLGARFPALVRGVVADIGLPTFVDTLGAILAPLYGILVFDYYLIRKRNVLPKDVFTMDPNGPYFYKSGWNVKA